MRKILAVDIDGTLVDSKKVLRPKTKDALIRAQEMGHVVVIVTGRNPHGAKHYAKQLEFDRYGSLLAGYNGAYVENFKTGEVLVDHKIPQDLLESYLDLSKKFDSYHIIYKEDKIHTNVKDKEFTKLTAKINRMGHVYDPKLLDKIDFKSNDIVLGHEDPSVLDKAENALRDKFDQDLNIVRSTPYYLEAMPKGINKGSGIIEIGDYYNLGIKDIIAFGDELNDLEMIKEAGTGVAMANANPLIKDLADYITLSNDQDGIAHYLEKFNII